MIHLDMIGCGRMGGAMLSRWLECLPELRVRVIKPSPLTGALGQHPHVTYLSQLEDASAQHAHIVMLAIKPQRMAELLPAIAAHYGTSPLFITIAAGLHMVSYHQHLGEETAIIRAMPNTPVALGKGMTSLVASAHVTHEQRALCDKLCDALGEHCWLEDEALMDAATAIAGSGPAYIYGFMDALTQAGTRHGLSSEQARHLSIAMTQGAAAMASQSQDSFVALQQQVTSKGGTTEAALDIFNHHDALQHIVGNAIDAAMIRAQKLASS